MTLHAAIDASYSNLSASNDDGYLVWYDTTHSTWRAELIRYNRIVRDRARSLGELVARHDTLALPNWTPNRI